MRKHLVVSAILIMLASGPTLAQQDWTIAATPKGRAQMVLQGGNPGDVPFPHETHQSAMGDCKPCHELFPQEEGSIETFKAENRLKKKKVMKTCQKCHRKLKKAGEKSGPTGCGDCHSVK